MAQPGRSRTKGKEGSRRAGAPKKAPRAGKPSGATGRVTPKVSGRYTPPIPRAEKVSSRWVPISMFTFLGAGMLMIVLNYLGLLPGGADNWYLMGGLGLITAGFITATRYR